MGGPLHCRHFDERGRNWLHFCCMAKPKGAIENCIRTADDLDEPAFTEGEWRATPVRHCTANSNSALARHLLERGASPDHSLFAACYNNDLEMIRLLVNPVWRWRRSRRIVAEDSSPLFAAVKFSRSLGAEELLKAGCSPDFRDSKGNTALHIMLKKGTPPEFFEMFVSAGARGDIRNRDGKTAIDILRRKRDPVWHDVAERLKTT